MEIWAQLYLRSLVAGFKDLSESQAHEPANAVFAIPETKTPPILELFLLESSAKQENCAFIVDTENISLIKYNWH